jgi:hypothetical protein
MKSSTGPRGGIRLTNAEFLRAVFPNLPPQTALAVTAFGTDPNKVNGEAWRAHKVNGSLPAILASGLNQYFSVASLRDGDTFARDSEHFQGLHVALADDIGENGKVAPEAILLPPSYEIETSPDNCQYGYLLREPITDLLTVKRLHKALAAAGLTDKNGLNPVRYGRLVEGVNTKAAVVELCGEPFASVLHTWEPERRYSLQELVEGLGLDLDLSDTAPAPERPTALADDFLELTGDCDYDKAAAEKIAADAAQRTLDDPDLGRHAEIYRMGCYAARDGLPAGALTFILQRFSSQMRPCNTQGEAVDIHWPKELRTIRDAYTRARSDHRRDALEKFADAPPIEVDPDPFGIAQERPPESPPALKDIDLSNLLETEEEPTRYIIEPFIPRENVTLFGGHGGAGKSICALSMAVHIAVGEPWGGFPTISGRVLVLSMEDPEKIVRDRLRRICKHYGFPPEVIAQNLTVTDATEHGPLATEIATSGVRSITLTWLYQRLRQRTTGYDLVVIDNASDAFDGDENHRRQVRVFITALRKITKQNGCGLMLLAHIDKNAARYGAVGNTYSGSTAWHNSARSRIALTKDDGDLRLVHEKLNVGRAHEEPVYLRYAENGVLVVNIGAAFSHGEDDAEVFALIKMAIDKGITLQVSNTGQYNPHKLLEIYPEMPEQLKGKQGKRRFDEAVLRLEKSGLIVRQPYKNNDRKDRIRWALVQEECF